MSTPAPGRNFQAYLSEAVERGASDIHLTPGLPAYLRVHGDLEVSRDGAVLSNEDLAALAEAVAVSAGFEPTAIAAAFTARGSLDGALTAQNVRFRFNIFRRQGHHGMVLRRLEDEFRTLAELGFPESLYRLCDLRDGLVVISGATGAGKSTTLASLLDRINRDRPAHIITIEDPIEYIHKPVKCVVNQRQIGLDSPTFNDALVASLRQDPDVILVGEIRDLETIRTAITAAETGHLVFTTLHASDCVSSIERLVGVFPADEQEGIRRQLSLVLRCIVAQHLLPASQKTANERVRRVVASEVLMVTPAIANLTATARSAQIYSSMEAGQSLGMQTLEQDLARLCVRGDISESVAMATARNTSILKDRIASLNARGKTFATAGGQR